MKEKEKEKETGWHLCYDPDHEGNPRSSALFQLLQAGGKR